MENESKSQLIIFRVRAAAGTKLEQMLQERKIVGIKSSNQYARKILTDFLEGRLAYANPDHALLNPDL